MLLGFLSNPSSHWTRDIKPFQTSQRQFSGMLPLPPLALPWALLRNGFDQLSFPPCHTILLRRTTPGSPPLPPHLPPRVLLHEVQINFQHAITDFESTPSSRWSSSFTILSFSITGTPPLTLDSAGTASCWFRSTLIFRKHIPFFFVDFHSRVPLLERTQLALSLSTPFEGRLCQHSYAFLTSLQLFHLQSHLHIVNRV